MSTTVTTTIAEPPRYEYYFRESSLDNKREILTGDRTVETFNEIPLVDVSRIFSDDLKERQAIAKEIADVCKRVGFMYIKNHGVSQDLIDTVFDLSRKYHAQSSEIKKEQYVYNNKQLRGYDEHYDETPEGPVCTYGPRV